MITARATAADLPQMKQLWKTCFQDDENYVNQYFRHFSPKNAALLHDGGRLCAMALWMSVRYVQPDGEEQKGAYLYAVGTNPSDRGKGCCRTVCAFAEQLLQAAGCDFTFLHPSDAGLVSLYEKLGYRMSLTNGETQVRARQLDAAVKSISAEAYLQLRQMLLWDSFIDWQLDAIAYQAMQGELLQLEHRERFALAAVERSAQDVYIKEFLGDSTLAGAIPARYGAAFAVCRSVGQTPFAMAKALTGKPLPTGYPGFAFD